MAGSPTEDAFRESARLRDDELIGLEAAAPSPRTPGTSTPRARRLSSSSAGSRSARSSDVLSPAQRTKREAIAKKKAEAKARKAEKKAVAERERAEAEAAARLAQEEEAEAEAAEAAAAQEAADVEAAERALEGARTTGDAAVIAAAEERLARERAEADAAKARARRERAEAKAARERAAKEAAEAEAAEAALQEEAGDEAAIQAEEEKALRRAQRKRDTVAQERERKIALKRKVEVEALKLETAESKNARQKADALDSVKTALKSLRARQVSAERRLATATVSGDEGKIENLTDQLHALREAMAPILEQERAAAQDAKNAAQASKLAAEQAAAAKKDRENAEKQHVQRLKQDEEDREEEIVKLLQGRADREESRFEAKAAAEEEQFDRDEALEDERAAQQRSAAEGKRAENIQSLRRQEVDAENLFKTTTDQAREKKDAYNRAATKLKQLQKDVTAAKNGLAIAHKAEEQTSINEAEERLIEVEVDAKSAAAETASNKTDWEQAETDAKAAGNKVAEIQAERKAAEQEDAELAKQSEQEIAAATKQRVAAKNARIKKREKEKVAREKERAKSYAAKKKAERQAAAKASKEAAENRESRDVERAFLALLRAREGGDPATIAAAEQFLAEEKAKAAAAAEKADRDRASAAEAAKEAERAEKARFTKEKAEMKSKRQEAKRLRKLKQSEALQKERAEMQLAQDRADKEHRDVARAEKDLMDARKSKDTRRIEEAEAKLLKETREAKIAALHLQRERAEVIEVLVKHETEAQEKELAAKEKAAVEKLEYERAVARLQKEKSDVAKAERKLEEAMSSGDADATKEAEEVVLKEKAEAEEAAQLAAKEASEAKYAAAEAELAAQEATEEATVCRAERVLAEKQRDKLEQLERKLKDSMARRDDQMQKAAMLKLGQWLRGRGYSLHLHEVVDKLSTDGHQRGHPPGSGWISILEQWSPEEFETYMVDIHGDEDWQSTQASQQREALSRLQHPVRKPKAGLACCAVPHAADEAHRRVKMEMRDVVNARAKYARTRMAVEEAQVQMKNAEVVGNKDAMRAAERKLPQLLAEHREASTALEKEQQEAEEAHAQLSDALRPTKSHLEPVRVTAHGRELIGRAKPPAPRLVRADSAEVLYEPPREFHLDKSPWQHPALTERQRREKIEHAQGALSKSVEDSATDTSIATKDETLDRSHEKDERDYLDLSGIGKQRQRGVLVSVMACRNLPKADTFGENDTYVKVRVAGDEQKTTVINNGGPDPTWGENGHRLDFFPTVEGFPVIKVKVYDEDFGPEALTDDLLGKCDIDMGRLKLQLWESSEIRHWFQLVLKGKHCGDVELKIAWEPHPPLPDELGLRARVRAARRRKRKNHVYREGSLVSPVTFLSYSSSALDVVVDLDEASLKEELCGKWRARGTLDASRPSPTTRTSPGYNSQAWLETVGQEEEEFELSIDEDGTIFGRPLHEIDEEDSDFFVMAGKIYKDHKTGVAEVETGLDGVQQRWRLVLTQSYPVTGNETEWSAFVTCDGRTARMEDGEWTGSGIAGQFSAMRLCRSEPDASRRSSSCRVVRPARAELALAESRHAELEQEFGFDHPSTLQAHREKAAVMRAHGNLEGYRAASARIREIEDLVEKRQTWERYDPSSILNTQPQFSPAPSAVLPLGVDHARDDETDQTAKFYVDESVPELVELTLSPDREPAPQSFDDVEPDHIGPMLDAESQSSHIVSPSARLDAGAPDLDELLASDDEDRSSYSAGVA